MQYLNKTFTLPTTSKRMSQTEYEIAVGIRHPDGTLVQRGPRGAQKPTAARAGRKYGTLAPFSVDLQDVPVAPKGAGAGIVYHFTKPKKESNG